MTLIHEGIRLLRLDADGLVTHSIVEQNHKKTRKNGFAMETAFRRAIRNQRQNTLGSSHHVPTFDECSGAHHQMPGLSDTQADAGTKHCPDRGHMSVVMRHYSEQHDIFTGLCKMCEPIRDNFCFVSDGL